MKVIFFLFFSSFVCYCFGQNNNGIATYTVKTNFSFSKTNKLEEQEMLRKIFGKSGVESDVKFKLLFNNEESIYYGEQKLLNGDLKIDLVNIMAKTTGMIYTNTKTREIIQQKEKYGEYFRIVNSLDNHKWRLTNEKMKLGAYTCFKAILINPTNKINETVAWYSPDLPINIGPLGYCSLPGLVVMLKEDIFIYTISDLELNLSEKEKSKIHFPKKGTKVTQKRYDSISKLMREKKDLMDYESYFKN